MEILLDGLNSSFHTAEEKISDHENMKTIHPKTYREKILKNKKEKASVTRGAISSSLTSM